ncbi:MAG TPA: malate dehydrogenase [bacterium]|nr:malate dehydrogenase [bacterium]
MMSKPKVTVVGAGFVGATTAQRIVEKELADVVLIDIVEGLPQGKALDMMQSAPIEGFKTKITGTQNYEETKNSDIVVVTAGLARKPGMSRDDLLLKNAEIVSGIITECAKYSPKAILIIVTNPLDVMTYLAWKKTGFETKRVVGMAGALDSARYSYFLSEAIGCFPHEVDAMVLGGHGDEMVPVPAHTKAKGKPITQLLKPDVIESINQRTRDGGAEIVKFLKTGSAFYAPSSSVVRMVRSILEDRGEVIPCCVHLTGQYGIKDVYCGVPAKLGREGVREAVEIALTPAEKTALQASADHVRENCAKLSL